MQFSIPIPVLEELKSKNIIIDLGTIKAHEHQGWMSSVFIVQSNIGPLIIHSANMVEEHKRNKVWEKFFGLSTLLASRHEIPTPAFHYTGLVHGKLILVQDFFDGTPAGKRILNGETISDEWSVPRAAIVKKILVALTAIHKVHLKNFGWPVLDGELLGGKFKTWQDFLAIESPNWIRIIIETDQKLKLSPSKNLETFIMKTLDQVDYSGPSVLVHGDAINPSNILINKDHEVTILDWEWSIAGDPAWEFCDLGWWPLLNTSSMAAYFKAARIESEKETENFLRRVRLYIPLWLLWGTYMHANDVTPNVYMALRKLLIASLSSRYNQ